MGADIYSSLSGANASWDHIDRLSQDIANSSTVGFKRAPVTFTLEGEGTEAMAAAYTSATVDGPDLSDGPIKRDGNPTHLALQGRGFFVVDADGTDRLTRAGDFRLDAEGTLVTQDGHAVLGSGGEIQFEPGQDFLVDRTGRVFDTDGNELDQLRLEISDSLRQVGGNLWEAVSMSRTATDVQVEQGALEGSNADPVGIMVELIEASRYFEAYQRAMQTSDEMDQQLNNTGRR